MRDKPEWILHILAPPLRSVAAWSVIATSALKSRRFILKQYFEFLQLSVIHLPILYIQCTSCLWLLPSHILSGLLSSTDPSTYSFNKLSAFSSVSLSVFVSEKRTNPNISLLTTPCSLTLVKISVTGCYSDGITSTTNSMWLWCTDMVLLEISSHAPCG